MNIKRESVHKWNIDITLTSGVIKRCVYRGPEDNIYDVTKKLFDGRKNTYYVDLFEKNEKSVLFIRISEIAAIEVHNRKVVS